MAKKPKKDQLSLIGVISALLRNSAQQRALARTRDRRRAKLEARRTPEQRAAEKKAEKVARKKAKKAKAAVAETRTPERIESDVDSSRAALVTTVSALKYDLDVPARLSDARARIVSELPPGWRGEVQAALVAGAIVVTGWGALAWSAVSRSRRR